MPGRACSGLPNVYSSQSSCVVIEQTAPFCATMRDFSRYYPIVLGKHPWALVKHQKLRVGGCMEEVLEWFSYPLTSAHSGCENS